MLPEQMLTWKELKKQACKPGFLHKHRVSKSKLIEEFISMQKMQGDLRLLIK